jgi:hypothetical protein
MKETLVTSEVVIALLVAALALIGSALALLVVNGPSPEDRAPAFLDAMEPEENALAWEWRLLMASAPESYWF